MDPLADSATLTASSNNGGSFKHMDKIITSHNIRDGNVMSSTTARSGYGTTVKFIPQADQCWHQAARACLPALYGYDVRLVLHPPPYAWHSAPH